HAGLGLPTSMSSLLPSGSQRSLAGAESREDVGDPLLAERRAPGGDPRLIGGAIIPLGHRVEPPRHRRPADARAEPGPLRGVDPALAHPGRIHRQLAAGPEQGSRALRWDPIEADLGT